VADQQGNFSMELPLDKTMLIVKSFGAEPKEVALNESESYMVQLEPDFQEADVFNAIVSGKKHENRSFTKSLNTVIPQGINSRPTHSITEVLERATPGILPTQGLYLPPL